MTEIRRVLERKHVTARPELVWNAFVDLLAQEDHELLSPRQRVAHLAFWYDSEVQNGGHSQYLDVVGLFKARQTVQALETLDLQCQAMTLESVLHVLQAEPGWSPSDRGMSWDTLRAAARWLSGGGKAEGPFEAAVRRADTAYHECKPTMMEALAKYLARYQHHFIELR